MFYIVIKIFFDAPELTMKLETFQTLTDRYFNNYNFE